MKIKTYDLHYLIGKNIFGDDGSQNMFVYQPTFNTLELKPDKGTDYIIGWPNSTPLVVEQNNYTTKIVKVYIVYDLDNWPKVQLRNFTLRNCLFGATSIVKNNDK